MGGPDSDLSGLSYESRVEAAGYRPREGGQVHNVSTLNATEGAYDISYDDSYNDTLYGGELGDFYGGSDHDDIFIPGDKPHTWFGIPIWVIVVCFALLFLLFCCWMFHDAFLKAWHRRQAARAARAMAAADDGDAEMSEMSFGWLGTTQPVRVTIEMSGIKHTIGAPREAMESVSRLPFVLTDACEDSGYPELADVDLVDLLLKKRAELSCIDGSGISRQVDGTMTAADLTRAKSFHVLVLS